ncbi:MAG: DUF1700 domain-containing protein [Lachnospiraceae bacterium]|nr:DUF1700 domain-containing protein [Lachnospiraceae bacterium]
MNRAEFMKELERLLQNIPENEKVEALNYYEEYFSDAGEENEQKVIAELESPQKVADKIKDGLRADMDFRDTVPGNGQNSAYQSGAAYQNGTSYQGSTVYQGNTFYQNGRTAEKEGMPTWAIVLIVIGCIICSPLILAAAGTLLGVLGSIFLTVVGLVLGLGGGGIGLLVAGVALVSIGIANMALLPFVGMVLIGAGCLCLAFGILFMMLTIWLCGWAVPALCRGIVWLCRKPFEKTGVKGEN